MKYHIETFRVNFTIVSIDNLNFYFTGSAIGGNATEYFKYVKMTATNNQNETSNQLVYIINGIESILNLFKWNVKLV